MGDVEHERELREAREEAHNHVHELEKEAREAAAAAVAVAMAHLNNVRQEAARDRLESSKQISNLLSKDDFRREHAQLIERVDAKENSVDKEIADMREWRANLNGRIWVIPAVMSLLTLAIALVGIYLTFKARG
jgi:hypothetical protein